MEIFPCFSLETFIIPGKNRVQKLESREFKTWKDQGAGIEYNVNFILCTEILRQSLWSYDDVSSSVQVLDFVQLTDSGEIMKVCCSSGILYFLSSVAGLMQGTKDERFLECKIKQFSDTLLFHSSPYRMWGHERGIMCTVLCK